MGRYFYPITGEVGGAFWDWSVPDWRALSEREGICANSNTTFQTAERAVEQRDHWRRQTFSKRENNIWMRQQCRWRQNRSSAKASRAEFCRPVATSRFFLYHWNVHWKRTSCDNDIKAFSPLVLADFCILVMSRTKGNLFFKSANGNNLWMTEEYAFEKEKSKFSPSISIRKFPTQMTEKRLVTTSIPKRS